MARAFAKEGANVLINGFGDAAEIEATRAAIERECGVRGHLFRRRHDSARGDRGHDPPSRAGPRPVDILVNNAGIQHVALVEEFPVDKWNAIIAINSSAAFHATRAAVPGMKQRGGEDHQHGAHSLVASPFKSAYVAAKHGIAGFTKTIGSKWRRMASP